MTAGALRILLQFLSMRSKKSHRTDTQNICGINNNNEQTTVNNILDINYLLFIKVV